jgi:KaiC/GvpD/RAD55 family RecA-like ATPase
MKYTLLKCGLSDYGKFIPSTENIFKYVKNQKKDHYFSIYYFTEAQKKQAEEIIEVNDKKRPRGIAGISDVETNRLVFDFDSESDIKLAKKDTLTLCERLFKHGLKEKDINICFSGKKGFAVELITDQTFNPTQFKNIVRGLASDLETFDSKVYNPVRVFRLPFTRHQSSKLYKTPLSYGELKDNTIDTITYDLAKDEYEPEKGVSCKLPKTILEVVPKEAPEAKRIVSNESFTRASIDMSKKPKFLSNWKYALMSGLFPKGCRSYAMMVLAATFKNQGFPEEVTGRMLKGAAELQAQRTGEDSFPKREIWENVVKQVYSPLWNGGTYSEENFPQELVRFFEESGIPGDEDGEEQIFVGIDDVYNTFANFAENIEANTIKTGIEPLDDMMQLTTSMLVGLLGAPSSGKTSVCLEILRRTSLNNENSILFSLDMSAPLVYQKLAQKVTGRQPKEIQQRFEDQDEDFKQDVRTKIHDNFKNMDITFKTALSVDNIRSHTEAYQRKTGKKVRLIVVDYLECINLPTNDVNTGVSLIAQQLKDIANDLETCVVLLLQPRKSDPSQPIVSYTKIKGASTLAQACSVVFSLHREGFNPETAVDDKFMTFNILKNRLGTLGSVDMKWNGLKGTVSEMDQSDKIALNAIRDSKEEEKDDYF